MNERERFFQKIREINLEIDAEEQKIRLCHNHIYGLKNEIERHRNSCNHKYDNGKSALINTSHWVSDIDTYIDDFTGEEVINDNGYTEYSKTCQICCKEI